MYISSWSKTYLYLFVVGLTVVFTAGPRHEILAAPQWHSERADRGKQEGVAEIGVVMAKMVVKTAKVGVIRGMRHLTIF